ncbi:MAG: class I SAM-dependent methyltransferase [Candidatus Omnitrophica bacterium]|nr:class I SAM-dependent methyltransferase [Candidatus Omnitrophota bacterium]
MEIPEYAKMYELEDSYWWYEAQKRFLSRTLEGYCGNWYGTKLLDAGCGTGGLLASLGRREAYGVDISSEALRFCKKRNLTRLARASVSGLPFKSSSFGVVVSMGVLYHRDVGDDMAALSEIFRVMTDGGLFIVNVPAFSFLTAKHDELVHAKHRYTLGEVKMKVLNAGFAIERITYRDSLLFPVLLAGRLLERVFPFCHKKNIAGLNRLPGFINDMLKGVLFLENELLLRVTFPFGSSVFCVAKKPV